MNTTASKKQKPSVPKALGGLLVMGLGAYLVLHILSSSGNAPDQSGADPAASSQEQAVQQNGPPPSDQTEPLSPAEQVYEDQVDKYAFLVNNRGTAIEGCVQAGLAKAAAENINNAVLFQRWQYVEKVLCDRDGNYSILDLADPLKDEDKGTQDQIAHGYGQYRDWVLGEDLDIAVLTD